MRRGFLWPIGLGLLLLAPGCGYKLASHVSGFPAAIQVLAVPTLVNKTTLPQVEQLLTRALIERVSETTKLQVTSEPSDKAAVLHGEVLIVSATPVLFTAESFASTFLVNIMVSIRITTDGGKKVIFSNPSYVFRDQYVISADVKQFFSEQNPALRRVAADFAASVVTTFMNGF